MILIMGQKQIIQSGIDTELQLNPSFLDQHYPLVDTTIHSTATETACENSYMLPQ